MRRWIAFAMLVLPELEVPFKIMTLALIFLLLLRDLGNLP